MGVGFNKSKIIYAADYYQENHNTLYFEQPVIKSVPKSPPLSLIIFPERLDGSPSRLKRRQVPPTSMLMCPEHSCPRPYPPPPENFIFTTSWEERGALSAGAVNPV